MTNSIKKINEILLDIHNIITERNDTLDDIVNEWVNKKIDNDLYKEDYKEKK